jgi:F-type H+-transporting ATPase subunit epsilon
MSAVAELKLSILCPERRLVEDVLVSEVILPGSEGEIQILPDHAPMIGTLETGFFRYQVAGRAPVTGVISSGFFEVKNNVLSVLAETVELQDEIDLDRAKRAQSEAEETLKTAELDEKQFKKYQLKLQRAMVRQQLGGK